MIETPADILAHYASRDAADSFIAYRKKHKRASLSERGAMMIAKTLCEINAAGGDASEALDIAQERGWQTIRANWYFAIKGEEDGNRFGQSKPNATMQAIAFAGTARRAPDENCF